MGTILTSKSLQSADDGDVGDARHLEAVEEEDLVDAEQAAAQETGGQPGPIHPPAAWMRR